MSVLAARGPAQMSRAAGPFHPLSAGGCLNSEIFAHVRRRMVLEFCKWDPQVGDVSTLSPFPLFIAAADWHCIGALAESLAAELTLAESELLERPELWRVLGIPRRLRRVLARAGCAPKGGRILRFDFHWTSEGWRISEVNSDVPGGFAEAGAFPRLIAEHVPGAKPAGDPTDAWADAFLASAANDGPDVALLAAPGFMEDYQVVAYLARALAARGCTAHLVNHTSLRWEGGRALVRSIARERPLAGIIRFYQAEWLAALPRGTWEPLFTTTTTPVINPGFAVLSESKRFPLVWDALHAPLLTWRKLLPETRDPRQAPWRREDDGWLLKGALCNTGDAVAARDLVPPARWRAACRAAWMFPGSWAAQRRFDTLPIQTPTGSRMFPCIGVYTVNGQVAGAYARLSHGPIVDYRAIDAALLVRHGNATAAEWGWS